MTTIGTRDFLYRTLRPWLIHRRQSMRWTQKTLAVVMEVNERTVAFWEQGRRKPELKNMVEWIRCLE